MKKKLIGYRVLESNGDTKETLIGTQPRTALNVRKLFGDRKNPKL